MEFFGAFIDEEWESLSKMFDNSESSIFPSDHHTIDTNYFCSVSQESSNSSEDGIFLSQMNENHQPNNGVNFVHDDVTNNNNTFQSMMNFYTMDCNIDDGLVFPNNVMEEILNLKVDIMCNDQNAPAENGDSSVDQMQLKRKNEDNAPESPKKKPRVSRNHGKKNQRAVQSKKKKKVVEDNENNDEEMEMNNGEVNTQSLSGCSSEDDSNNINGSDESKGSPNCLNSKGKARANRGSATDPQSLYARKRRERINERLRILQNLVPNGTKVDISTMLEEAVHYVKFLQLQIKLLSSDDLWMFAPIAYNGMDLGMYHKISPNMWPLN